jgi:hypothetical protein
MQHVLRKAPDRKKPAHIAPGIKSSPSTCQVAGINGNTFNKLLLLENNSIFERLSMSLKEKEKRWEREDRLELIERARNRSTSPVKRRLSKHGSTSYDDSKLVRDAPEFPGPDCLTRVVAWSAKQKANGKTWKELVIQTGIGHIKSLASRYLELGGQVDGTLLNSGVMSFHAVELVSRCIGVKQPSENDIRAWLPTHQAEAGSMTDPSSCGYKAKQFVDEIRTYLLVHGLIQKDLYAVGAGLSTSQRAGQLIGKRMATPDDVVMFLASHDEAEVLRIARMNGVQYPKKLLRNLKKIPEIRADLEHAGVDPDVLGQVRVA